MVEECPVAPGRLASRPVTAVTPGSTVPQLTAGDKARSSRGRRGSRNGRSAANGRPGETKTARFLALVADQHGPLSAVPLGSVARISAALAPQADLNTGSARTALRRAVLAAQKGEH